MYPDQSPPHFERRFLAGEYVPMGEIQSPRDWYPISLNTQGIWWRYLRGCQFQEPFFQDSLMAQPRAERRICLRPWSVLRLWAEEVECVPPAAFIFHISRCGSTLITQMLASSPANIGISEPPVLDAFFRHSFAHPEMENSPQSFRALIQLLGQRRGEHSRHLFVKCDSWHIPWIPFVRSVFPFTPVILLYREPAAVLASHQRQRGPQMVPGLVDTSRLKVHGEPTSGFDLDLYCLMMLKAMLESALHHAEQSQVILFTYRQLVEGHFPILLQNLGLEYETQELRLMQERSRFHSKQGRSLFGGDPPPIPRDLSTPVEELLHHTMRLFENLETKRRDQQQGQS